MTDLYSKIEDFYFGVVNNYVEDRGFGFITSDRSDSFDELFFHVKNTKGAVGLKDLVIFKKVSSIKHMGKFEAVAVAKIKDVNSYLALVKLYLRYGYVEIRQQAHTISSSEEPTSLRNAVIALIENHFQAITNDNEYRKVVRLIKVIRLDQSLDASVTKTCLYKLLMNAGAYQIRVFLAVHKYIDPDSLTQLNLTPIAAYDSLPPLIRRHHYTDLSIPDRIKLKGLKEVNTPEDLKLLWAIINVPGENIVENYHVLKDLIIINSSVHPFLWERGILPDTSTSEIKADLTSFTAVQLKALFSMLTDDEKIKVFPTQFIETKPHYELYKTLIRSCEDIKSAISAFEIAGILLSPAFYYQAIVERFLTISQLGFNLLQAYLIDSPIEENLALIAALGWRTSIKLFNREIQKDPPRGILKILKSSEDFKLSLTDELKESIELSKQTEILLWTHDVISAPPARTLGIYFLTIKDENKALGILKKVPSVMDVLESAVSIYTKDHSRFPFESATNLCTAFKTFLPNEYEAFKQQIYTAGTDALKLFLWLKSHSDVFDFHLFKIHFITLSADDQKRFIKKTFFEIQEGESDITSVDVLSLKNSTIDPALSRNLEFANEKVDFSVFVILQAIEDLANGRVTKPERIYNIIADQIQTPTELLVLNGFFDNCLGRKHIDQNVSPDEEGLWTVKADRGLVPRFVTYCEGRKAIEVNTMTASICEKTGREFWWCRNSKCYENCVKLHSNWIDYTLLDLLEILNIQYSQSDYEMFLGYVNKVNKFLEHMTCRECSCILKPNGGGKKHNYGFHRVSNFICSNEDCPQQNEEIYLTHCINGHCGGVIDSRDCVRCKPSEKPQGTCGWYICNECYACCNDEGIERRKYIMEKTNQSYNCHNEGHREKGLICCTKCGTEMNASGYQEEDYKKVLNWFIKNRDSSPFIVKSGTRKDGKYWFIIRAPNGDDEEQKIFKKKLFRYMSIGFNIPDLHQDKDTYLIAEAFHAHQEHVIRLLSCPSCDFSIDLREDYEKYLSISKYHKFIKFSFN